MERTGLIIEFYEKIFIKEQSPSQKCKALIAIEIDYVNVTTECL